MAEVIADQVGRLSFDVDDKGLRQFDKGLKEIEKSTDAATTKGVAFGTFMGNLATKALDLAAAVGKAAISIGKELTVGFAEQGAELDKWARKLGITTQELQRLEFAGASVGAEADNVREAYKTLTENLGELARVGSGPAVDSLATLGLTLADFDGKGPSEQLEIFADAMNRLPDQAQRISVALEVMGEDGGALLPLFEQGSEGIRRMTERADELGVVLDDKAIAAAKGTKLALGEMTATIRGAANQLASRLAPKVTEVVERITRWFEANRDLIDQKIDQFVEGVVPAFEKVVAVGEKVGSVVSGLVDTFGGFEGALTAGAAAVGVFAIAMGGIPGIIAAASAALALGISELAGFRDEVRALQAEIQDIQARNRRLEGGGTAIDRLTEAQRSGELGRISETEFQAEITSLTAGLVAAGVSEQRIETSISRFEQARERQAAPIRAQREAEEQARAERSRRVSEARDLEPELRRRLKARAARKGVRVTDQSIETAVARYRMAVTEGSDTATAAMAAWESVKGTVGGGRGGGPRGPDLTRAREMFGEELGQLARVSGVGDRAIEAALRSAAQSLEGGAAPEVARAAAIGQISSLSGVDLQPGGIDAALFGALTQVGGPQAAASAAAGARFVSINNTWNFTNTFELALPDGFGTGLQADSQGVAVEMTRMLTEQWTAVMDRFGQGLEP